MGPDAGYESTVAVDEACECLRRWNHRDRTGEPACVMANRPTTVALAGRLIPWRPQ
jgi:hypothetical protein